MLLEAKADSCFISLFLSTYRICQLLQLSKLVNILKCLALSSFLDIQSAAFPQFKEVVLGELLVRDSASSSHRRSARSDPRAPV